MTNVEFIILINTNSQIKFKTLMLKPTLSDYSYAYILVSGTITVTSQAGDNPNNINKKSNI